MGLSTSGYGMPRHMCKCSSVGSVCRGQDFLSTSATGNCLGTEQPDVPCAQYKLPCRSKAHAINAGTHAHVHCARDLFFRVCQGRILQALL